MSKMRKLLAILLTFAMVLGMSITTFAAGGTITVTGEGIENLYIAQVIKTCQTTRTGWEFTDGAADAYIEALLSEEDQAKEDADQLAIEALIAGRGSDGYLNSNEVKTALNTIASNLTFTEFSNGNVPTGGAGVYAIKATGGNYTYSMMAAYVGFGKVEDTYPVLVDTTIEAKRQPITVDKKAHDNDHLVNMGDEVMFTIETNVPSFPIMTNDGKLESATFFVYDKIIEGAEYVIDDRANVKVGGIEVDAEFVVDEENNSFSINLSDQVDALNSKAGLPVVVTYYAKVTGLKVNNQTWIGHEGDEYSEPTYGNDEEKLVTGELTITKKDAEDKKPLENAKFVVYRSVVNAETGVETKSYIKFDANNKFEKWVATEKEATRLTTNKDGQIKVEGLDAGYTYKFQEVEAPAGYSLNETDEAGVWEARATFVYEVMEGSAEMLDTRLVALPSTGGIGTTMFTIGGCAIMIAAAYLFFTSRKREEA